MPITVLTQRRVEPWGIRGICPWWIKVCPWWIKPLEVWPWWNSKLYVSAPDEKKSHGGHRPGTDRIFYFLAIKIYFDPFLMLYPRERFFFREARNLQRSLQATRKYLCSLPPLKIESAPDLKNPGHASAYYYIFLWAKIQHNWNLYERSVLKTFSSRMI